MDETSAKDRSEAFLLELRGILAPFVSAGMISINPQFEEAKKAIEQSNIPTQFPDLVFSVLGHPTMAESLLLSILSNNGTVVRVGDDGSISVAR